MDQLTSAKSAKIKPRKIKVLHGTSKLCTSKATGLDMMISARLRWENTDLVSHSLCKMFMNQQSLESSLMNGSALKSFLYLNWSKEPT